jgi:hypothetical protein
MLKELQGFSVPITFFLKSLCVLFLMVLVTDGQSKTKKTWAYDEHSGEAEERDNDLDQKHKSTYEKEFVPYMHNIGLGIGTHSPFLGRVQVDDSGTQNGLELNPAFTLSSMFHLSEHFAFTPSVSYIYSRNNAVDLTKKKEFNFKADLSLILTTGIGPFHFLFSPGLYLTRISGDGGETTLKNGNATESFYLPKESSTAYNFSTGIGSQWYPFQNWSFKSTLDFFNYLEPDNLRYSLTLTLNWHYVDPSKMWR